MIVSSLNNSNTTSSHERISQLSDAHKNLEKFVFKAVLQLPKGEKHLSDAERFAKSAQKRIEEIQKLGDESEPVQLQMSMVMKEMQEILARLQLVQTIPIQDYLDSNQDFLEETEDWLKNNQMQAEPVRELATKMKNELIVAHLLAEPMIERRANLLSQASKIVAYLNRKLAISGIPPLSPPLPEPAPTSFTVSKINSSFRSQISPAASPALFKLLEENPPSV